MGILKDNIKRIMCLMEVKSSVEIDDTELDDEEVNQETELGEEEVNEEGDAPADTGSSITPWESGVKRDNGNPITSAKLFYNKSVYFWSPWSGPLAEGTMARNPWSKINPLTNIASTPAGSNLVYGNFGKIVSWLWVLAGMYLLFTGFYKLWKLGGVERILSVVAGFTIGSNWLITLITIGDHRFRVPIMGLSLFIQGVGFVATFNRKALQIAQVGPLR